MLNCRIEGLESKTPDLVIIDRNLKIKGLKIFKYKIRRKILIFTSNNNKKDKVINQKFACQSFLLKKEKNHYIKIFKFVKKGYYDFDRKWFSI